MIWAWIKSVFVCPNCSALKRENRYLKALNGSLLAARGITPPLVEDEPVKIEEEEGAEIVQQHGGD